MVMEPQAGAAANTGGARSQYKGILETCSEDGNTPTESVVETKEATLEFMLDIDIMHVPCK